MRVRPKTITPAGGGGPTGVIFKIRLIWEEEAGLLRGGWEEECPGEFLNSNSCAARCVVNLAAANAEVIQFPVRQPAQRFTGRTKPAPLANVLHKFHFHLDTFFLLLP
jgi:hypothetical protein